MIPINPYIDNTILSQQTSVYIDEMLSKNVPFSFIIKGSANFLDHTINKETLRVFFSHKISIQKLQEGYCYLKDLDNLNILIYCRKTNLYQVNPFSRIYDRCVFLPKDIPSPPLLEPTVTSNNINNANDIINYYIWFSVILCVIAGGIIAYKYYKNKVNITENTALPDLPDNSVEETVLYSPLENAKYNYILLLLIPFTLLFLYNFRFYYFYRVKALCSNYFTNKIYKI